MQLDADVKIKAYAMYLENCSQRKIMEATGISMATLNRWLVEDEWRSKREAINDEMYENADSEYKGLIAKERIKVVERHIAISKAIETRILEKLEAVDLLGKRVSLDARTLDILSKALKNASDVAARACGLSDKAPLDQSSLKATVDTVNGALLLIGMRPQRAISDGAPKDITNQVVDVTHSGNGSAPF